MENGDADPEGPSVGRVISMNAMEVINAMRCQELLCDGLIYTQDGGYFPVHRAIVGACSAYFRTLFISSLTGEEKRVSHVPGVSTSMMSLVVEYAYTRNSHVTEENVVELLITADYLCVLGLLQECTDFLKGRLCPENCIGFRNFARTYFCRDLEEVSQRHIMKNFVQILENSEELLALPIDEVMPIFGDHMLNVKNEETVWDGILKWIAVNPKNRKQHVAHLMGQVRLGLLDKQYFIEKVKENQHVIGNDDCRPLLIETLKFMYDLEIITTKQTEILTPELARPRIPHDILFAIGGWSGGSPTNFMETYDTRADRWIKVEEVDPAGPRAYHGLATIGHCIYVMGGFNGFDYFNSCRCFNAVTKIWREVAPMNFRRCYVSVAVLDDVIYAMGGYDGHRRQNSAEKFDYHSNQWTLISAMNMQRSDADATSMNGKVYIAGGFNGLECLCSAEVYDPETNQWTMIANMRTRRSGVSCISYDGMVYAVGGFNGIDRLCSGEKYNPDTNTWTFITDMYNNRSNFAIEVIDDMVFAIGGFNGVGTIFHVECYDEKTKEWYEATDMNLFRSAVSACVVSDLPTVHDYIHQHREHLMEEKRQKFLSLSLQAQTSSQL